MSTRTLDIVRLLTARGSRRSDEAVSHLQHGLQSAALANEQHAPDEVVLAALLHDVGHLISDGEESASHHHGIWGARYLQPFVPSRTAALVERHVIAKRYLCTVDRAYAETLSPVSLRSWLVQGGPLDAATLRDVERQPWLADALRIRCWDDLAKDPRARSALAERIPRSHRLLLRATVVLIGRRGAPPPFRSLPQNQIARAEPALGVERFSREGGGEARCRMGFVASERDGGGVTDEARKRSKWYWPRPDPGKVELLASLLSEAFPGSKVTYGPDLYPDCWFYRVADGGADGREHRRVIVMREFFESNDSGAIRRKFRDWRLARILGARASVLISEVGPDVGLPEEE